jgi:predicted enzyme related to lactoylglutathione lyase
MAEDWARPVVRWELQARDPVAQREFYSRMFNWEIGDGPVMNIPVGIGGPEPGPGGHIRRSETSRFVLYVQVRDLRESLDRAKELGGRVLLEPRDLPTGQTIAAIADPEGNPVALVQQ